MTPQPRSEPTDPWYRDGLRFACTRCGACCTGAPGYVWVGVPEIDRLAAHLGLTRDEFSRRYVRGVAGRYSLVEKPGGDCTFWDATRGCTVYEARPEQCRTWPFWPDNVETPEDWSQVEAICPGAGRGPIHDLVTIQDALRRTPQ
jgi:Fe-S-cluster containining protein